MTTATVCPQCGKSLSSDAPQGLCAECLLKAALAGQSMAFAETGILNDSSPANGVPAEAGARLQYFGDYELIEEIARGGMGVVWKARQTSLNRIVALKMIRAGALASADEVQRFLREAEAAANLQHPNIVAIHEVGEQGGLHYFSMDFVAGRDLGALVREGPLPAQRAARYVKIIAEAIHFAHQRGTLHRDLKPQNVLIDAADQPRITDFGLAKIMEQDSRLTQSGVVMGSPSYMPPEQAASRHGEIGPCSDVYSLGAILFELLTGRPPFRADTVMATLRQVIEVEPVAPRRLKADVPPDLETICLKCLNKWPAARYHSARDLADELARFLKGEPILARPAGMARKAVNWGRHHPGILAALAALAVVGLAFGSFYLVEENAFLRARQADSALIRAPGAHGESLELWTAVNSLVMCVGIYSFAWVSYRARRLTLKDMAARAYRPLEPIGEKMRTYAICAGLGCVASGVLILIKMIQVQVWEGDVPSRSIFYVYAPVYFGLALLGLAIRDYRLVHYGLASRQPSAEQVEPIRLALEGFDIPGAIRLYRKAIPDAGLMEAREYALRLEDALRAQNPEKFALPTLSLTTLNWRAAIICACVEGILGGILWMAFPPSAPIMFLGRFASIFVLAIGLFATLRVKGDWKWMLLFPGLVMIILSETNRTGPSDASGPFWPYFIGFSFGLFVMSAAFTRRRRRA